MDDIQVLVTLPASQIEMIKTGLLEKYPNNAEAELGVPLTDDQWLMTLPGKVLGDAVKDGLAMKASREAKAALRAANEAIVTPSISVSLPDGTIITG